MTVVLNENREEAVKELERLYIMIEAELNLQDWCYYQTSEKGLNEKGLNDLDTLNRATRVLAGTRFVPITTIKKDNTLYLSWSSSYRLKFWNAYLHLTSGSDFSSEGIDKVLKLHMRAAEEKGLSFLARKILYADIKGQSKYYEIHKELPRNKGAFIDSCIRHGIGMSANIKH